MRDMLINSSMTELERSVVGEIKRRQDDLRQLLAELVRFDTRTPDPDFTPREETALQAYVADRLRAAGLDVDVWEPNLVELDLERYPNPPGYSFRGRPQLLARAVGRGRGRSLLFNGHVDVVNVEPRDQWSTEPFAADVRDGRLYGRGACDMKAGVAAMILATEVLRFLEIPLRGDLLVNTVTDEELTGGGSVASIARGARADGALIPEPTNLTAWLGTRGSVLGRVTVEGRAGHAGVAPDHWTAGGPVNAVEKAQLILQALQRLREEWHTRPDTQHACLYPSSLVPTSISSGQWMVSYPAACVLEYHVQYSPGHADEAGFATNVEREITQRVQAAALSDSWLSKHPPRVEFCGDSPPSFHPASEPISATLLGAMTMMGLEPEVARETTFFDGAILSRSGTPAVAFGPGHIKHAHAVDEFVPLGDVVTCAQVLALAAIRFCGIAA